MGGTTEYIEDFFVLCIEDNPLCDIKWDLLRVLLIIYVYLCHVSPCKDITWILRDRDDKFFTARILFYFFIFFELDLLAVLVSFGVRYPVCSKSETPQVVKDILDYSGLETGFYFFEFYEVLMLVIFLLLLVKYLDLFFIKFKIYPAYSVNNTYILYI